MQRQKAWPILVTGLMCMASSAFGDEGPEDSFPLKSGEIREAFVGKGISYTPTNSADMGIREEFHSDGRWRVVLYGRGPIPSSGKWSIADDQMCVAADGGTHAELWHSGRYCRAVWRDRKTGELRIEYLPDRPSSSLKMGFQTIAVDDLPTIK